MGSCATRDVFRFSEGEDFDIALYFRRSSLISVMSPPINCSLEEINLESKFERFSVFYDFQRKFFDLLSKTDLDLLIVDFIDERFNILEIDEKYCTKSNELIRCGLLENLNGPYKELSRYSLEVEKLWIRSCGEFCAKLKACFDPKKILVHEAYGYAESLDPISGEIKCVDKKQIFYSENLNKLLNSYYRMFCEEMGCSSFIPGIEYRKLNPNHQWGFAPYHYIDDYYREVLYALKDFHYHLPQN